MLEEGVDSELVKYKTRKEREPSNMFKMNEFFKSAIQGLNDAPSPTMSTP
jgi:hypothetical protein